MVDETERRTENRQVIKSLNNPRSITLPIHIEDKMIDI